MVKKSSAFASVYLLASIIYCNKQKCKLAPFNFPTLSLYIIL